MYFLLFLCLITFSYNMCYIYKKEYKKDVSIEDYLKVNKVTLYCNIVYVTCNVIAVIYKIF